MRYSNTFCFWAVLLFVIAVATVPLVTASDLDSERGFPDDPGYFRLFNIPGAGFNSAGAYGADVYFFSFGSGRIEGDSDALHAGCVMAPVTLPDDGVLYQFYASFYDNDVADYVWLDFYRIQNYTGVVEKIGRVVTTEESSGPQSIGERDIPVEYRDIDHLFYSYYVATCLGNDAQGIYSARLWHHPEHIFSDGFESGNYSVWSSSAP